jgi:zinc protease
LVFLNNATSNVTIENFGSWKTTPLTIPSPQTKKALSLQQKRQDVIIKDKTSADVMIGQSIGIDRLHEDFLPLFVGVYVLGGNFSARLVRNRTNNIKELYWRSMFLLWPTN